MSWRSWEMPDINEIKSYLKNYDGEPQVIMEVCGTHTASISENGIADMLSDKIRLISGPGCPVCVTAASYIDKLVELSLEENTTVVTFGDMLRVPGSRLSLSAAAAQGASVKMVYSPFEIIDMAKKSPERKFVFAAVGFETTTPAYALIIERLIDEGISNVKLLTALKTMPQAIRAVHSLEITGFISPGHVAVMTGHRVFEELSRELGVPFVTAGFGGEELLAAIYALVRMNGAASLNMYLSAVTYDGNKTAKDTVDKYFVPCDAAWRGLGIIEGSGMRIRDEFAEFDAGGAELTEDIPFNPNCSCADIIRGKKSPLQCPMFSRGCTPDTPQGACMVSAEGACFHYYINGRKDGHI